MAGYDPERLGSQEEKPKEKRDVSKDLGKLAVKAAGVKNS